MAKVLISEGKGTWKGNALGLPPGKNYPLIREKRPAGFSGRTPYPHPAKVLVALFTPQIPMCTFRSILKFKSKEARE